MARGEGREKQGGALIVKATIDKGLCKPYRVQFFRRNRAAFALSTLMAFLTAMLNLCIAWLIQQTVDAVSGAAGSRPLVELAWLCAGVLLCILLFSAVAYAAYPRFMMRAMRQFKEYAFGRLMRKSIASFQREPTARYLSAFANDMNSIEQNDLESVCELISQGVLFVGSFTMMLLYSPLLTVIACAFFVPPLLVSLAAGKRMAAAERVISERNERLTATLKDCLNGFPVVKSFKAEGAMLAQFTLVNDAAEAAKRDKRRLSKVMNALTGMTAVAAQLGTLLAGEWLMLNGWNLTIGVVFVFLNLTGYVLYPIRELPGLWAGRKAALGLMDKLAREMESNVRNEGATLPARLETGIALCDVSFAYEGGQEALRHISVCFEAGKSYAVVGASGSGKSTLLNLLMGSHGSYTGSIRYDGHELHDIHSDALYEVASMIQQNVFVFDATIRENITMFGDFPKDDVDAAIQQAGLSELLARRGGDALCGENGSALSGGEKQRISIARSLLRKSSVLLVDEATAALDADTAYRVASSILALDGLTRVVVTHAMDQRLLARYDGILVLKDGRLVEQGRFDELLARRRYFYALYTMAQ